MSSAELRLRLDSATSHLESLVRTEVERVDVGDGRVGFSAWRYVDAGNSWPVVATREGVAAAWLHTPPAAGPIENAADPIDLARDITNGTTDRAELGAPAAAFYLSESGLRISNDRLGMVRLYEFAVKGFGHVWSSRPGLAHIFGGLVPRLEQSTWSDMATLGWAADGSAHLGNGHQMAASTTIQVDRNGHTVSSSDRDEWLRAALDGDVPSIVDGARGMVRSVAVASWWQGSPVADLSGGKDSRVTAAAAIRAGVVSTVRTVNTDTGEVDTARELLRLAGNPVAHRVDQVVEPKKPQGGVLTRYLSMHRAWEGAYNARSAYRSIEFRGFTSPSAPRINGLGGEAIQGRTMVSPAWREKLEGGGPDAGRSRLAQMVRSGAAGVTDAGIECSLASIDCFVDRALMVDMATAFMVVDYFYHFSKMPFWSMPQASSNTLLPFYSPQVLPRTMWSLSHAAAEYGQHHRDLLRELQPAWADVPFYKGSVKTRGTPWMWENADWREMSSTVLDGVGSLDTFSTRAVSQFVQEAEMGTGNVRHELALTRVMWELSFREYVKEVARAAEATSREVLRVRAAERRR
ncbi:hypothetical protein EXU48_07935 [Occultella glacieicola]|uniref:Asparagine synthetase domain-containing protein n=1 Tax=Occultella glacieicola TaxID=2518684 RepID=A0ABY2E6E6_9MICO|nr:hypothetical protein [Occultella glacieicola]TDE96152.1 hypothetical protein EXU48_07935 [Occultella glacieicola]